MPEVADDFLASAKAQKKGPPCTTGAFLVALTPEMRSQIMQALDWAEDDTNRDYNYVSVANALEKHGLGKFSAQSLARHHRGRCTTCPLADA